MKAEIFQRVVTAHETAPFGDKSVDGHHLPGFHIRSNCSPIPVSEEAEKIANQCPRKPESLKHKNQRQATSWQDVSCDPPWGLVAIPLEYPEGRAPTAGPPCEPFVAAAGHMLFAPGLERARRATQTYCNERRRYLDDC